MGKGADGSGDGVGVGVRADDGEVECGMGGWSGRIEAVVGLLVGGW